jgi:hypothetical protein
LKHVFPALAIVEDQNPPPAYQRVPHIEDVADGGGNADTTGADAEQAPLGAKKPDDSIAADQPVTASLRGTYKLLKSHGGHFALLRGLDCIMTYGIARALLSVVFLGLGPFFGPFASVLSSLCLVQLSTTWLHIVMTPKSNLRFWRRLPPFRKTFVATGVVATLSVVAQGATSVVPYLVGKLFTGTTPPLWGSGEDWRDYYNQPMKSWGAIPVILSAFLVQFLVLIPAQVALYRVQASLLPADAQTIVPFDRTFGGRIDPTTATGRTFANIKDAFATFSRDSWKRLYILYIKLFLLDWLIVVGVVILLVPQFMLMQKYTGRPSDGSGGEL